MKKIVTGDTVLFKATAHDTDGTALPNALVTLVVTDSNGSQVLSSTVPYDTDGTFSSTESSVGWGLGAVKQNWTIEDASGTLTNILENEFKVVTDGTTFDSYVFVDELQSYFPAITDYLDNKSEDHVIAAYKYENRLIESLGYSVPMTKNLDGYYDQSLRDFNANEAIYRIINANQANQVPFDENGNVWYDSFKERARDVYKDWSSKKITFKKQVSAGEAGISPPSRTQGSSVGTMLNNSESTYGSGFRGDDFERTWSAEITGTGTAGELRECSFVWSNDGGLGSNTATTSDSWTHLKDQVYIRFTRGTHTGTTGIFVVGDKWEWKTNPVRDQVGGKNIAVGY